MFAFGALFVITYSLFAGRGLLAIQLVAPAPVEAPALKAEPSAKPRLDVAVASLPFLFEKNTGQSDSVVDFLASRGSARFFFTKYSLTVATGGLGMKMRFIESNKKASSIGVGPTSTVTNYFVGNKPTAWRTKVPTYNGIEYKALYPHIDLQYGSEDGNLNMQFIVQPKGDPNAIALAFDGTPSVQDKDLVVTSGKSYYTWKNLEAYQMVNDARVIIPASFRLSKDQRIRFTIGKYDKALPLIIDPLLTLSYASYLGGSAADSAPIIKLDGDGNIYLFGVTSSTDFPVAGAFQGVIGGGQDIFAVKINSDASALVWATYLGGSGTEIAQNAHFDSSGAILVIGGTTSTDYPTQSPFQAASGGSTDGILTKLDSSGSGLIFSTYIGGSAIDILRCVRLDSTDTIYAVGNSFSSNFPVLNPFQATFAGGSGDVIYFKMNSSGSALVYSSYLGGDRRGCWTTL